MGLERTASVTARRAPGDCDGPLPPPLLRAKVVARGHAHSDSFLAGGRADAAAIRALVAPHSELFEQGGDVLDYGCGCGRVARWLAGGSSTVHGTDLNTKLVDWCRANLPMGSVTVNGLAPPTTLESGGFDLIYALSVFTHLTLELQEAWIAELRRLLRPGGLLLVTVLGERYAARLPRADAARFAAGEPVVVLGEAAGSNLCLSYHPRTDVTGRLLAGFDILEQVDADLTRSGLDTPMSTHDVYLARVR